MNEPHTLPTPIPVEQALEVLANLRRDDQLVVTNQISARLWPALSDDVLDFNYNPSTMGGAVPLGLGLAMAQPQREVLVLSGDGSLLMSLGCLVTVVGSGVENITVALLDNGVYEVTGGQKRPASEANVDFAGLARSAGFPNVSQFLDAEDWQRRAPQALAGGGPRFIWLQVQQKRESTPLKPARPIGEQVTNLRAALTGQNNA